MHGGLVITLSPQKVRTEHLAKGAVKLPTFCISMSAAVDGSEMRFDA